ncbi:MAG: RluA family pseudouridine synthase [Myxococcota bacterium]
MKDGGGGQRVLVVDEAEAGRRLDAFLSERLSLSRAEARRLLDSGRVRTRGPRAKGALLAPGDEVRVERFRYPRDRRILPEPEVPLCVLAQGRGWLAVDKPAGHPVHPYAEEETGSVMGAVVARYPELQGVGEGGLRSGVVHRLDVGTSGVLLVATDAEVWERLREGFRSHRAVKRYRALVVGDPPSEGAEEVWLRVARHRPARVEVAEAGAPGARRTWMRWRRLEVFRGAALLEIWPATGFLHQIRATLASRGCPVAGDEAYRGDLQDLTGAKRPLLHAARLELDEVRAASDDPPDFAARVSRLREAGFIPRA